MNIDVNLTSIQDAFDVPASNLNGLLDSFKEAIENGGTISIYQEMTDSDGNKERVDIKKVSTKEELENCIDNSFRNL